MPLTAEFKWTDRDKTIVSIVDTFGVSSNVGAFGVATTVGSRVNSVTMSTGPDIEQPENGRSAFFTVKTQLIEDLDIDVSSEFGTPEDMVPFISLLNSFGRVQSLAGGTSPEILNMFRLPVWEKTNPIKIMLTPIFYTRSNPDFDVLIPVKSLSSLTILRQLNDGQFRVPGAYLGNAAGALKRSAGGSSERNPADSSISLKIPNSNFFSFRVPGLINLETCLLLQAKPKWSKQKTESGVPLWAVLEMQVQTFLPASTVEYFKELQSRFFGV